MAKRKSGLRQRQAAGRPRKVQADAIAPALWQRIKTEAMRAAADPRLGTELGRLSLHGEITSAQASAGFRVAHIYGRFERFKGWRRSTRSPSYETGFGGDAEIAEELLGHEIQADLEERIREAADAFNRLQEEIPVYPPGARALLEALCVEDRAVGPAHLDDIRAMLDRLAGYFGIVAAPKARPREAARPITPAARRQRSSHDADIWRIVISKLRPDLSLDEINGAIDIAGALKAREIVRRERVGKVLALPGRRR